MQRPYRVSWRRNFPALHLRSLFTDFSGEMRAEPIDPEPDTFMADVDTALVEQVFDIPKG